MGIVACIGVAYAQKPIASSEEIEHGCGIEPVGPRDSAQARHSDDALLLGKGGIAEGVFDLDQIQLVPVLDTCPYLPHEKKPQIEELPKIVGANRSKRLFAFLNQPPPFFNAAIRQADFRFIQCCVLKQQQEERLIPNAQTLSFAIRLFELVVGDFELTVHDIANRAVVPKLDRDERVCLVGFIGQGAFELRLRPSTIASGVRDNMEGEMPESRL